MNRKRTLIITLVAALLLTGCTGGGRADAPPPITTDQRVEMVARDNLFGPTEVRTKAGPTAFVLRNEGYVAHNLQVRDAAGKKLAESPLVTRGKSTHVQVDLPPGAYQLICTVPGHADMKASLTVE